LRSWSPALKFFRFEKKHGFIFNMDEKEIAELKNEVKTAFDFVKAVLQKRRMRYIDTG